MQIALHCNKKIITCSSVFARTPIRSPRLAVHADPARRIETCLLDTVERSGLEMDQIDAVVRTGGSAQIPCFIEMMERIFGPNKVVLSDVFSGVTSGLAIRAYG
jgi:molecular chaperone DnaK (HSP70)